MLTKRATLIQCISEYLNLIKPHLNIIIINEFPELINKQADIIKWLIDEELELIYGLFEKNHIHNHHQYSVIHSKLESKLHVTFSLITSSYIRAPIVYDENVILTTVTDFDLYIYYFTDFNKGIHKHVI